MKKYYGENVSFLAKAISTIIIVVSFIFMIKLFPQKTSYYSDISHQVISYYKGSWIVAFGVLLSGLICSTVILLLESILHNIVNKK